MSPDDAGTTSREPRRGRRAARIIGAVLVILAVAAGAFLLGRTTAPGPAVVVVSGGASEEIPPVAERLPLIVPGATAAPSAIFSAAEGLSNVPGTATGYRLTTGGLDGAQVAASLAAALGVPGEVREYNDGWIVGGDPGPTLQVADDAYLSWTLTGSSDEAADAAPLEPARAREIAADLLGGIGVAADDVDWQVERFDDRVVVTAWQLVDDARTGLAWTVGLDGTGVLVSASGMAAGLEAVPGYPVIGAATAVRRSAVPAWSSLAPRPVDAPGPPESVPSPTTATTAPGAGPQGRPALSVPISAISVTDAELTLAQYRQPDGSVLLLPSYLLTGADGSRWTLLAVNADYVEFVDVPYPSPQATDG